MDQKMEEAKDDDHQIDLPPGFRFHPTDEELISHYLCKKIGDGSFVSLAVGEADLNKCEPWDLPAKAKMGEDEWYFFCLRDKKYPTGQRTNRATQSGYWKATGKDKEIFRGKSLIGMKKTLVFYRGRAPKGGKSNWVMHEYRLEGKLSLHNLPHTAKTEWVISRVFEKSCNGKKMHAPGAGELSSFMIQTQLPPLVNFSQSDTKFKNYTTSAAPNVPCFSNHAGLQQQDLINSNSNNQIFGISPSNQNPFLGFGQSNSSMFLPGDYDFSLSMNGQDSAVMRSYLNNSNWPSAHFKSGREMVSVSQETGLTTDVNVNMNSNEISSSSPMETVRRLFDNGSASGVGPVDLECMWRY